MLITRRNLLLRSALAAPALILPSRLLARSLHGQGGGGGYVAKAVDFDGLTNLHVDSLFATDNEFMAVTGWFKFSNASAANIWTVDPLNTYTSSLTNSAAVLNMGLLAANNSGSLNVATRINLGDNTWHSYIACGNCQTQLGKVYVDDIDVTNISVSGAGFNLSFNSLPFYIATDTFGQDYIGDGADWRIMPGANLLDDSNDIPLVIRRLFVTSGNKPVDPAVATASLGAPAILFSGDHTTFATNQGTGGAFTLTGTLTNATTSPSD